MNHIILNNDIKIPALGFGVFQINDSDQCENAVLTALQTGYRLIDTAAVYGNERAVGNAMKRSGIPREEVFVVSKVWIQDAGETATRAAFERTLRELQTDYLDLYLIHMPYGDYLMVQYDITPMAWAPFAEGLNNLFQHPVLSRIGAAHGKTAAQVALRWLTQNGIIAIPKSVNAERIAQNFASQDFELSAAELAQIAALDFGKALILDTHSINETYRLHDIRVA